MDKSESDVSRKEINPDYKDTRKGSLNREILEQNKIVFENRSGKFNDQIKIVRTQVLKKLEESGGNTLLVTSARPGEGKSLVAINLAISITLELDKTALIVDADLRKPSIHHFFGYLNKRGLSDYLSGKYEIPELLVNPGIQKLTLILGGKRLLNSPEVLGGPKMELLVKELKERYPERFIIFDCSPMLECADAQVFSKFSDGILFVVEAEKTSEKDIRHSMDLLKERPVIGTVFNKFRQ